VLVPLSAFSWRFWVRLSSGSAFGDGYLDNTRPFICVPVGGYGPFLSKMELKVFDFEHSSLPGLSFPDTLVHSLDWIEMAKM
jgi:hypothetical protein